MDASEYARIYAHETTHFWYRGLHALVMRAVDVELARLGFAGGGTAAESARPRVLDAGCGTGGVLSQLDRRARAYGFDVSRDALGFCARRGHRRLARASITSVPFADASFDGIVSLDVLYHRAVTDDHAALRELARLLRPGGFLILNLPAHPWLRGAHDEVIHTARRYTKRALLELAAAGGLGIARLSYFNCTLFPLVAALRLLVRRPGRSAHGESDVRAMPWLVERVLTSVLRTEGRVIMSRPLPWGLSLFAILRKPVATAARRVD
jgi:SAM-dependent methyltransferase